MPLGTVALLFHRQHLGLSHSVGKERGHKELTVVYRQIVGKVGIMQIVFAKHDALLGLRMDHHACSQFHGDADTIVPYGHLTEIGAFVEGDDAMLRNRVAAYLYRLIV